MNCKSQTLALLKKFINYGGKTFCNIRNIFLKDATTLINTQRYET